MKEHVFSNGLKLIYIERESNLTSVCISIDGGADMEEDIYGLAHATEHMVYKGTKNRSENKINSDLSAVFGFNNAMTNYPYVIYYGTLLEEDLSKGLDILGDVIINPIFPEKGFEEEIKVIKEELEEWDEELEQFTEDKQFFNTFERRRIKYPIIGRKEDLENITLKDIKNFYNSFYFPGNSSIAVVSGMDFDEVKFNVWKVFREWEEKKDIVKKHEEYDDFKEGIYKDYRDGIANSKIQFIFPIEKLNDDEIKGLRIFNELFSNGINSILYNRLRTENGLIYDVIPKIAYEKGIKLYKITLGTANANVNNVIEIVNESIRELTEIIDKLEKEEIENLKKAFKLKRLFREEQGIILAKELGTYDTMYESYKVYLNEDIHLDYIDKEYLKDLTKKLFSKKSIQVISNKR
ncbi:pitrilysin family protein [uncultured Clostridium sp.]|uniref:M16 family metallopeptidase n=1 Tax=uncultured Clostridium sp. TaxID=59620 RepID=UPI00262F9E07|nr:pitrilysin family protein [uncultured Clostridium sp.]